MNNGFIVIHRKMLDWEWFEDHKTFKVFMTCLLSANHKDRKYKGAFVKRGEFLTSYEKLAIKTSMTTQNVRTILKRLSLTSELTIKTSTQGTRIIVNNYDYYQSNGLQSTNDSTNELTINQQSTNNQLTTNNNDNNENNENKKANYSYDDVQKEYLKIFTNQKRISLAPAKSVIQNFVESQKYIPDLETWVNVFLKAKNNKFCNGDSGWQVTLPWLCNYDNFYKVESGQLGGNAEIKTQAQLEAESQIDDQVVNVLDKNDDSWLEGLK